jgi:glutathione S-transferase
MKLVGRNLSPYTRRCAIALTMLGVPHERAIISTAGDDAKKLFAFNPLGRVPALVLDDGETLIESGAILDHILEAHDPRHTLLPARGPERRRALRVIAIATGVMDKGVAAFYEMRRRPPEKLHPPWLEHLQSQVAGGLAALEALPQSPWLLGAALSLADVTAAVMLSFLRVTQAALVPAGKYPKLEALTARAEALAAFKASPLETP